MRESKDEKIIDFLDKYEYSESLSIFFSLRRDCKGVVDPPIVLEHQIQRNDGSRSLIQDLEMLVKDGELRKLKIPRSIPQKNISSCIGYCLKGDILRVVSRRIEERYSNLDHQAPGCDPSCLFNSENRGLVVKEISKLIREVVFDEFKTISVNKRHLLDSLDLAANHWKTEFKQCREHMKQLNGDLLLNFLIKFGVLRRDASDLHTLIFTTPSMGLFIEFLESGNKVIVSSIKRNKYKELFEDKLYSLRLGKSQLPTDFHLRDLSGTGIIKRV
ncbi:hypothetical protein OJ252_1450 [Cryptosporidium canis]|uniref:Uncharacterized protein n=1 Tax=Cryptosporidium canis TaxID=195482 RepID=A0ABQ8P832_9CRYT|nr:hypothetical protein OJ252_1450 [Cryptosporidium canis]